MIKLKDITTKKSGGHFVQLIFIFIGQFLISLHYNCQHVGGSKLFKRIYHICHFALVSFELKNCISTFPSVWQQLPLQLQRNVVPHSLNCPGPFPWKGLRNTREPSLLQEFASYPCTSNNDYKQTLEQSKQENLTSKLRNHRPTTPTLGLPPKSQQLRVAVTFPAPNPANYPITPKMKK